MSPLAHTTFKGFLWPILRDADVSTSGDSEGERDPELNRWIIQWYLPFCSGPLAFLPSGRFFVLYLLGGIGSSTLKKTLEHIPGYEKSLLARMEPADIHDRCYKTIWAIKVLSSSSMSVDCLLLLNLNLSI